MTTRSILAAALLAVLPIGILTAQVGRGSVAVPLKSWMAPLYWQPSEAEAHSNAVTSVPKALPPASSLVFVAMTPCRVVDTRTGQGFTGAFGPPSLVGQASRTFPIQSSTNCTVPATAQAYSLNVTVVPPGFLGFITVYPTGSALPAASTLNDPLGIVLANAAIVPAGNSGSVDVFANNATDIVIDINGYYAAQNSIAVEQGSAGAPSMSFSGDSTTGIFSLGLGNINFASMGVTRLSLRQDGDLDMTGNLRKGGGLFLHTLGTNSIGAGLGALSANSGTNNAALGAGALAGNTSGNNNTAVGGQALQTAAGAADNTAVGFQSLQQTSTNGVRNTAVGSGAMQMNSVGYENTAIGVHSLFSNTNGPRNVALGYDAMFSNTTGGFNTAVGEAALSQSTTGNYNTGIGAGALLGNKTGSNNTATGVDALEGNSTGAQNTSFGSYALRNNTTANDSVAIGAFSLMNTTTGANNIALGTQAGLNVTTQSNNIHIGNQGTALDSGSVRIGTIGTHTTFFAAGVSGQTTGGSSAAVVVDVNGQFGTIPSSRRYKENIRDMGDASSHLLELRPVTFNYRQPYADGSKPLDYGLIAEEVAEVYPDLVVRGTDGQVETVQYHKLAPMLLNEVQKLHTALEREEKRNRDLESRLAALEMLLANKTAPAAPAER